MARMIATICVLITLSAFADTLTMETLTVDTSLRSICGVSLGMTKTEVQTELGKRKLNFTFGQKFDANTKKMIPDESLISVNAQRDRIIYSIMFKEEKVWLQEILFAGYSDGTVSAFATKLWKPVEGTAIDVTGQTIQIYRN